MAPESRSPPPALAVQRPRAVAGPAGGVGRLATRQRSGSAQGGASAAPGIGPVAAAPPGPSADRRGGTCGACSARRTALAGPCHFLGHLAFFARPALRCALGEAFRRGAWAGWTGAGGAAAGRPCLPFAALPHPQPSRGAGAGAMALGGAGTAGATAGRGTGGHCRSDGGPGAAARLWPGCHHGPVAPRTQCFNEVAITASGALPVSISMNHSPPQA